MVCDICKKGTIGLAPRAALAVRLPAKCPNCHASYKPDWSIPLCWALAFLEAFCLTVGVYGALWLQAVWLASVGILLAPVWGIFMPLRLNRKDPANEILARVHKRV